MWSWTRSGVIFMENEKEAVKSCLTISGAGFSGVAQNNGMIFVMLKDWDLRNRSDLRVKAVAGTGHEGLFPISQQHRLRLCPASGSRTGYRHRF